MARDKQLLSCIFAVLLIGPPPQCVLAQPNEVPWWFPSDDTTFDTASFSPFMGHLTSSFSNDAKAQFHDHISVLPVQRTGRQRGTWRKPEKWKMVTLVGFPYPGATVHEEDKARLAVRIDNFYIVGFANKWGKWHSLSGSWNLFPDSVRLDFEGSYPHLVGGSTNLHTVPLGKDATTWARHVLANFDISTSDQEQLKLALAILVITVCEAARFPRIRAKIEAGWITGTYLNERDEEYLVNWRTFSCAIMIYETHNEWGRFKEHEKLLSLEIKTFEEAEGEIDLLLQSKQCSVAVNVFN